MTEDAWEMVQKHLGYSDEEMKIFRANPRNEDIKEVYLWKGGPKKKSEIGI